MARGIAFFIFVHVIMTMLSFVVEGEQSFQGTQLNGAVLSTADSFTVDTTTGFLSSGILVVGNEEVCYGSKTATTFTGLTRGCNSTDASNHSNRTAVYSQEAGYINTLVGFNIVQSIATDGFVSAIFRTVTSLGAWARAFMQIIAWDYSFLNGTLAMIRLPLAALSAWVVWNLVALVLRRG